MYILVCLEHICYVFVMLFVGVVLCLFFIFKNITIFMCLYIYINIYKYINIVIYGCMGLYVYGWLFSTLLLLRIIEVKY